MDVGINAAAFSAPEAGGARGRALLEAQGADTASLPPAPLTGSHRHCLLSPLLGNRGSQASGPLPSARTHLPSQCLYLCWAACHGSQDLPATSLPHGGPCRTRLPVGPASPLQPAAERRDRSSERCLGCGVQSLGWEGTLRGQGFYTGRVQAASPCNYEGDCRWETGSSCMCPPGSSAPGALPVLPSCPGLPAHRAAAPGSVELHPPVTALALRGQKRARELAKR